MLKKKAAYPIVQTEDVFAAGNSTLVDVLRGLEGGEKARLLLVADMNVVQRTEGLGLKIGAYAKEHGLVLAGNPVVLPGGEKIKADAFQCAGRVVAAALESKIGRNDLVLALGGGTVMDVAGYVAAQVRGGVRVVRVPTTVAGMLDGAFAEYAALDGRNVKDALRVACPPAAVVIDPLFAKTVLDGVWRGGFSEAVRLAAVRDAALVGRLVPAAEGFRRRDLETLKALVADVLALRAEKGGSAFGEWAAERLETMSGYKLPHGYAVALGIVIDATYAVQRGYLTQAERDALCAPLVACGAMEGASHSRFLLSQTESLLRGLDAWSLATGAPAIELPQGLGKAFLEERPDLETMKRALDMIK